ncbi:hypothetical protein GP486_001047 [Trichoglossum hirsutum]|uniref:Ribosomal protein S15 n=1 Tax=Trichoglossum hirsutum TaxID=265104 RepID=A0A9P8LHE4_9PEZI|nr:hypothetical protein GP486_001047 [Trichoglossum hirsutum]
MPPRLSLTGYLRIPNEQAKAEKHKYRDPYALAQARQRKAANLARQEGLRKERAAALGDPVRGITTPFIESLDYAVPPAAAPVDALASQAPTGADAATESPAKNAAAEREPHLNFFLTSSEIQSSLENSYALTKPPIASNRNTADPAIEVERERLHAEQHENAHRAISRIVSLENGNSKDRMRANVQRCIDAFGRHNTDEYLAPRSPSNVSRDPTIPGPPEKTPRAGPDTGSPEVQIAILTAKIRVLANHLEGQGGREAGGKKDKYNKRNLRLLVHRRQKLLKYMRTKERGSERWQNLVQTLGLTDGTWRGEISL